MPTPLLLSRLDDPSIAGTVGSTRGIQLASPTIENLRTSLLEDQINVLHFAGSATYDRATGEAQLLFPGGDGKAAPLRGDEL